jgi:hypothetical protein
MDKSSLSKHMSDLRNLLWVVTGLVISIIYLFLFGFIDKNTFIDLVKSAIDLRKPVMQVQLIIIASILIYSLLWAHNGLLEIYAVEDWLNPPYYIPTKRFLFILSSIFIGVFLALIMVLTTNFEYFAFAVLIYCILDFILWYARLKELKKIISFSDMDLKRKEEKLKISSYDGVTTPIITPITIRKRAEYDRIRLQRDAVSVLRRYYLERRHYSRVILEIAFTLAAIVLFFSKKYTLFQLGQNSFISIYLRYVTEEQVLIISYLIIWISFIIAEIIIYIWRQNMHNSLNNLKIRLSKLSQSSNPGPELSTD